MLRRLYRLWKNNNPGYRDWDDAVLVESITAFVADHHPIESDISLRSFAIENGLDSLETLQRRLTADGFIIRETLDGLYLSADDAARVQSICDNYLPLEGLFFTTNPSCTKAKYSDFCKQVKSGQRLLQIRFRDSDGFQHLYYKSDITERVKAEIRKWLSLNLPETFFVPEGAVTIQTAAAKLSAPADKVYEWAKKNSECAVLQDQYLFVKYTALSDALARVANSIDIIPLVRKVRNEYPAKLSVNTAINMIIDAIPADDPSIYSGSKYIGLNPKKHYYTLVSENKAASFIRSVLDKAEVLPLHHLVEITGYRTPALINKVNQNVVAAKFENNAYFISAAELKRITPLAEKYAGLDAVVNCAAAGVETLFDYSKSPHRNNLLAFVSGNEWWGIEHIATENIPEINPKNNNYFISQKDVNILARHIKMWLSGYQRTNREKCMILISHFKNDYPQTCDSLLKYFSFSNHSGVTFDDTGTKNALDYLFSILPSELSDMNEDDLMENIIAPFADNASLQSKTAVASFLFDCNYTKRRYDFGCTGYQVDTTAYSMQSFSCMAYTTLNENAWAVHNLVAKAVDSKKFADMWLFVALHFFAAWRTTDFTRISVPRIKYPPAEVLERLRTDNYPRSDAVAVTQYLMAQIKSFAMTPSKTTLATNSYVPELHLFVPTDCEYPLGVILSIAAAHFELDSSAEQFVLKRNCIADIRNFFGSEFSDACNNKSFSTRRANKALMQAVGCATGNGTGPRPYLFASIMRSHKGGYAKLPETTEIYLRDANFSGYTPEFIIYQMFLRGICSFYADALLRYSFGAQYTTLLQRSQADHRSHRLRNYKSQIGRRMASH